MSATSHELGSRYLHAATVDGVLHVRIDRPERKNAMTSQTVGSPECIEAWTAFTEKREPRWPR
jgi:1,4-dihydroxy-2-naphthoyl-CoA synthase